MLSDAKKREAYDRFGHAGVDPNAAGMGGQGGFGGFSDVFGDIFGDIFGAAGGARGSRRAGRQRLSRRRSLRYSMEVSLEQAANNLHRDPRAELGELRHLPRHRRQAGHQAEGLPHLRRPGLGAHAAGLLLHPADLSDLPRIGQGDSRSLRNLRRRRPDQEGQDARGPHSRRHRHRHAHPFGGQRRAGRQRRARRRSVRGDPGARARGLRARRRRPGRLRDSDLDGHRRARRQGRGAHARGACRDRAARGTQSGKTFRLRGKGIKGLRSSYPGDLYAHVAVETPVRLNEKQKKLLRDLEASLHDPKHSPQTRGWMDKVKEFFQ